MLQQKKKTRRIQSASSIAIGGPCALAAESTWILVSACTRAVVHASTIFGSSDLLRNMLRIDAKALNAGLTRFGSRGVNRNKELSITYACDTESHDDVFVQTHGSQRLQC